MSVYRAMFCFALPVCLHRTSILLLLLLLASVGNTWFAAQYAVRLPQLGAVLVNCDTLLLFIFAVLCAFGFVVQYLLVFGL